MSKFPCTGCGLCCTKVGLAVSNARQMVADGETDGYIKEVAEFPHKTTDNGNCEHLQDDHTCAIYDTRPDICNIEKVWEKHHKDNISIQDYFISSAMLCNSLILADNADESFFINMEKITK
jgi:Fe-S-cluster containining protein